MDKSQERISLFVIFIALIQLSRCDFFVTVTEDEAVQLEFTYPCDSNTVTIQSANRLPFYNSARPENLNLPFYQLNRFSVTNENCSVQVEINPVKKYDEATYICIAYKDGVIHSRFTKIRFNVNYPPGNVACTLSINDDAVGDWVPLQCTAPVGSLAGGIYCYQGSKRLPPQRNLAHIDEHLTQTIWARIDYPIFCCSSSFDQPKDMCECKDFVWDPKGNISQTNTTIEPCPAITPGPVATLSQYPESEVEDNSQLPKLVESLKLTRTNKDEPSARNPDVLWKGAIAMGVLVIILVTITLYLQLAKCNIYSLKKTPAEDKMTEATYPQIIEKQVDCASQTYQKEPLLHTLSSDDKQKSKSWGVYWKEVILTTKDSTKSKSTSAMPFHWV